ncbi:MAG TPA: hypothetical protein V6D14_33910 [Coleofasciculaceae cyanobacterium]|jgi:hypothetical protein
MSFEALDGSKADLKQLWGGGKVPPLTPEETDLSLKLWNKIKLRKQREQKLESTTMGFEHR